MNTSDLHWLAGLMEGEGHFGSHTGASGRTRRYLRVFLKMCDQDVVERAARMFNEPVHKRNKKNPKHSPTYDVVINRQTKAAGWMMTLYPLLGARRQARIKELLTYWRSTPRLYQRRPPSLR